MKPASFAALRALVRTRDYVILDPIHPMLAANLMPKRLTLTAFRKGTLNGRPWLFTTPIDATPYVVARLIFESQS